MGDYYYMQEMSMSGDKTYLKQCLAFSTQMLFILQLRMCIKKRMCIIILFSNELIKKLRSLFNFLEDSKMPQS